MSILLIEDDPIMGESLMERFEMEGFAARWAKTAAEARQWLNQERFGVVLSDLRLPDVGGDALFREAHLTLPSLPPWLFITAYGHVDQAVSLLKEGAADYLTKPFDLDALIDKLKLYASAQPPIQTKQVPALGISPSLCRIEAQLPQLAAKTRTLLITGESGVGKEWVARAFHRQTPQGEHAPFVAVNCAALPEGLMEAELFGYEKGAFTGAVRSHKGVFEQADGGTLFLDEIGDMPLSMQVKLLRVLQERQITRIGGERPIPVDLRIVSATHQDLKKLVTQGRFREDLYYRLNVIQIHIPPLRQRREDILWLARRFLAEAAPGKRFSDDVEQALLTHDWPGNVRELKHAVERGAILCQGQTVGLSDLFGEEAGASEPAAQTLAEFITESERRYIAHVLKTHAGHLGRTAAALGISRKNLWEKMKKLGLSANAPTAHRA
ncbi:MAG: sigma-54-dependent transcriptional regulator [Thiobacillaceae bacterium]